MVFHLLARHFRALRRASVKMVPVYINRLSEPYERRKHALTDIVSKLPSIQPPRRMEDSGMQWQLTQAQAYAMGKIVLGAL